MNHRQRLLRALNNEPGKYVFTGVINDLGLPVGSCACGHTIRYEFIIQHIDTGVTNILGSTCITLFHDYNPNEADKMAEEWDKYKKDIKDKEKEEKERILSSELSKVAICYQNLHDMASIINSIYNILKKKAPYDIWRTTTPYYNRLASSCPIEYKTLKPYIKWYKESFDVLKKAINETPYKDMTTEELRRELKRLNDIEDNKKSDEIIKNTWLIVFIDLNFSKGFEFIMDMKSKLEEGESLSKDFSPKQLETLKRMVAKKFGEPGSYEYNKAEEYFDFKMNGQVVDCSIKEYCKQKGNVNVSNTGLGELPF